MKRGDIKKFVLLFERERKRPLFEIEVDPVSLCKEKIGEKALSRSPKDPDSPLFSFNLRGKLFNGTRQGKESRKTGSLPLF